MVRIDRTTEKPRRFEFAGAIVEMGYFRDHYQATIEKGDTLDEIACLLNVEPRELYRRNEQLFPNQDYKTVQLQEGQVLKYETPPGRGLQIIM